MILMSLRAADAAKAGRLCIEVDAGLGIKCFICQQPTFQHQGSGSHCQNGEKGLPLEVVLSEVREGIDHVEARPRLKTAKTNALI